jgi:hypothetical protein
VVLRVVFKGIEEGHSSLAIDAWMPSEVQAIWPLVGWLMRQIEGSRCVVGHESAVEPALQEALSNAVVQDPENRPTLDPHEMEFGPEIPRWPVCRC